MPKRPKSKLVRPKSWWQTLANKSVDAAYNDAIVDAYGDDEQHTGLLTMIENELVFPFPAVVMGELMTIIAMEWPEGDPLGLDFVFKRNGKPQRVDARHVEFAKPFPPGHLYVAAYLKWKRRL